jgi:uncharacterized protein
MSDHQPAFESLAKGETDELRRLLESDPAVAEACDATGVSLLMHSLYRGRRDLAEAIAARKKQLDIFEAASLGRLDRLAECARSASEISALSKDGFTALHFSCFFGQPAATRLLIQSGAPVDAVAANPMKVMPLHSAASARNLESARALLENGAPVNARQHGGWVPIHAAAQNGDRPMIELLLQHHADPHLANEEGKTPAAVAREKGHSAIAALLEK